MRRSFSAATLARLREMRSEVGLVQIAVMVKPEATFVPTKDPWIGRWHVCTERSEHEILTSGAKWYDTRARIGGGGAIDLTMHALGLSFVEAVKRLTTGIDHDGPSDP